ncbi:CDP-glycerol glycerophosphotransferase [Lacrimispora sphenoides]|jgi:CDP-glycerol glycerophosphotransferase|uniref:CDP-glycerol glycerophosphotransferase family protein n=1 Tax=Lacrimispora sphenoides TaxID=29370 RepID=UPI0008D72F63|nr:CDP-glycerol glycerophosphotransferase family protein [Lacrimispora sphenoides]SET94839.1 CDP-glycerol glycerophosphotransferase [Lacrimispora sphenoides]
MTEEKYINKRKRNAYLTSLAYHLLWILPVCKKKVVFTAFEGDGGYCCNPRYVAEALLKKDESLELVWLVNNIEKQFPKGIRKVKNTFWNRAYHLATAKVWIDNSRKQYGTAKRRNQLYIQVWHAAIGFKPLGLFRGKLFPKMAYLVSEHDSKLADYVISNSEWCTKLIPDQLIYTGKIIKTGSPRCDVFFTRREEVYTGLRKRYDIPQDASIVLFAPTFRGGSQKGSRQVFVEEPTLDFERMVNVLQQKFGGTWFVFLRLHPQLAAQLEQFPLKNGIINMIDVSQADDMNELAAASDVLITDYSSSVFDVINMYMPVFIYADDLEEYIRERGELMWDMYSLPFSVARNNDELIVNIAKFDAEEYRKKIDEFSKEHEVMEDGHASERVMRVIERFIGEG